MKFVLCMPVYKIFDFPAVTSLIQLLSGIYNNGDKAVMLFTHNYLVDKARQKLNEQAMDYKDVDYVVQMDSDMTYTADDLYKLIDHLEANKLQMLSAKYYVRGNIFPPRHLAMCNRENGEGMPKKILPEQGEKGIQDCDVVGHGFLPIKRDFMKKMIDKYKTIYKMGENGEDCYFCDLVKKEGERVCYDADIIVGHISLIINR